MSVIPGNIDIFDGIRVIGWVLPADGAEFARIDIYIEGVCIANNVAADQLRTDVRDAGIGSGQYGFEIRVPDGLLAARDGLWTVEVRDGVSRQVLLSNTFTVDVRPAPPPPRIAAPPADKSKLYKLRIEKSDAGHVRGWAVEQDDPGSIFDIDVLIDGTLFCVTKNNKTRSDLARKGISLGLGGVSIEIPVKWLEPGDHVVSLRLPNGIVQEIHMKAQTPVLRSGREIGQAYEAPLCVIIPVYNAYDDVMACIDCLEQFTPGNVDILFINDASPDPRIVDLLAEAARRKNMRVLTNAENLGFTRTVNRGIQAAGQADVILLNSDARVTPGWTIGLRTAAYSAARIATVTAMSDRAGAFSAPEIGNDNPLPEGVGEIEYARAFRRSSLGLYPRVPTGNGFCMYIRRACLSEIGQLDEAAFPRGYGEENDFCMRAFRAGWHNIIDDRTYVYHERTKSFGAEKTELMNAGRVIIEQRYPEYKQAISVFTTDPLLQLARFRARQAMETSQSGAGNAFRVLYVISTKTGGTPQTNKDLMDALEDALEGWTLRCDSKSLELCRLRSGHSEVIQTHNLSEPVDPLTHRSMEYDSVVNDWLLSYDFDIVHIRHLGWHSISLPFLVKRQERKVVFSFHDYYMLTPTVKMIDDAGVYLGETFTPEGRGTRQSLWPRGLQPDPVGPWLQFWRERNMAALRHCDAFVTTSESARELILEHLPDIPAEKFVVIPHGRDFDAFHSLREPLIRYGCPVKILVPGNIDISKGLDIIYSLAAHDRAGLLEFHVLGDINMVGRLPHARIIQHGKYSRADFAARVEKIRPHIGAVFSIWNETYCHTLTEMWSVGIPVAVFEMPTVAARVRASKAGWVFDHTDIPKLYENLLRVAFDPQEQKATSNALIDWQTGPGAANTTRMMAAAYLDIYRAVMGHGPGPTASAPQPIRIGVVCSSDRSLLRAAPSTFVRIWERTRNDLKRSITYVRMTPETLLANLRAGAINGAILQQTAIPRPLVHPLLDAFSDAGISYLVDVDRDLLGCPEHLDPEGVHADYAPFLREILTRAALVTVATPGLQATVEPLNRNVEIVADALSDRLWRPGPPMRQADDLIHALCLATASDGGDLEMILPALDAVAAEHPNFRLSLIGVGRDDFLTPDRHRWLEILPPPSGDILYSDFVPWLRRQSASFDFAIAPLAESMSSLMVSPLRLLEYTALGLPIIASDVVAYREVAHTLPEARLTENMLDNWKNNLVDQISIGQRTDKIVKDIRLWAAKNILYADKKTKMENIIEYLL